MMGLGADILRQHYIKQVESDGMALENVPEGQRSVRVCAIAIANNPKAKVFVPDAVLDDVLSEAKKLKAAKESADALCKERRRKEWREDSEIGKQREQELREKMSNSPMMLVDVNSSNGTKSRRKIKTELPHSTVQRARSEGTTAAPQKTCKVSYVRRLLMDSVPQRDRHLNVDVSNDGCDNLTLRISGQGDRYYGTRTPSRRVVVVLERALREAGDQFSLVDKGWDSVSNLREVELTLG